MSYAFPPDIQQLVAAQLASGRYANEDDVLRDALQALSEFDEDVDAVQAAIDEWQAGDEGIPLDEAIEQIRERFNRKNINE